MKAIFKFRIESSGDKFTGASYSNNRIPAGLTRLLGIYAHTAIKEFNGELHWCKTYISFSHGGVDYTQVDSYHLCKGCCFLRGACCEHPYFSSKPNCEQKIYVIK